MSALDALLGPAGPEIGCEECFEMLDVHVELEVDGSHAGAAVPACALTSPAARRAARSTTACAT